MNLCYKLLWTEMGQLRNEKGLFSNGNTTYVHKTTFYIL